MRRLVVFFLLFAAVFFSADLCAQDFGFGFDDEETTSGGSAGGGLSVSVGGEVSASLLGYLDDFSEGIKQTSLGDVFSGNISVTAKTSVAEGLISLNVEPSDTPISIDEAYLRAYFGNFDIEAGYRKLTWGKADNMGPLDVINPLDTSNIYTEMADNVSLMGVKIARPMLHATYRIGQFSKIEGVFIPNFEPHYIATEGRWAQLEMKQMAERLANPQIPLPDPMPIPIQVNININPLTVTPTDTSTLDYAQGGLRFTTTVGSADIGAQYYYGRMPQPAAKISLAGFTPDISNLPVSVDVNTNFNIEYLYNPYHQIGIDYAQVLFDFNVRAELAANITEDLKGDDGSVYNPSVAWSFGFDRNLFAGINLNLQINESIRLMHDKLGSKDIDIQVPDNIGLAELMNIDSIVNDNLAKIDIEGGKPLTSTRLTAALSKKFLRDELELRAAIVWGIEDMDCLIMPALIWTKDDLRTALAAGFFAGDKEGQLGQYKDNNFIKVSMTYSF